MLFLFAAVILVQFHIFIGLFQCKYVILFCMNGKMLPSG